MPAERTCSQCGAQLPANSPGNRCPKCLFQLALEESGSAADKTVALLEPDVVIAQTGMMIGRYKLLQQIGEGGFGIVFMAEQTEPVHRKVALKVIKAGMDSREVIARFEAERQALALMDHPNIAQVLDGGATASGRPYFVMELVRGVPITDYCDHANLSTRQRLELFIQVCRAVQHAHQKGVIHRDLKPGNVMVTLHDGEPVPKVIDFGVAKALGQKLTEKTLFTRFEQMIGTPAYMSPEQAALEGFRLILTLDRVSGGREQDWTNAVPALSKAADGWTRERIRRELHDRTRLQAELLHFLGHLAPFDESCAESLSVSEAGDFVESPLLLRRSLLQESLSLYQQVNGPEHPLVAEVLNDLASDLSFTPEEAEKYARAALVMRKKLSNAQGLEVADSLVELGNALMRQTNKTAMAEAAYLEALAIRTNHLRPETLAVASLYGKLSGLQESKGDLAAAEQSLRHAALSRGQTFFTHYGVSMRLRLASMLRKRGDLFEAEQECREALEASKESAREFPDAVAAPLEYLVLVLSEQDKLSEAETRGYEFLAIFEHRHPQPWRTFNVQSKLGGVLLRQKKYPEAEPMLLASYEGLKARQDRFPAADKLRLKETLQRLVQLYEVTGQSDQAADWKKNLAEFDRDAR